MEWHDILDFVIKVISAAVGATLAVWRLIRGYVDRKIVEEKEDRELADTRIEGKQRSNSEKIHVQMGKLELLEQQLAEQERVRVKEMFELKTAIQEGLHRIEIQLERLRGREHRGD